MREKIDSFPVWGKSLSFTMTVQVAGLTNSVLLAMNVFLVKECDKNNFPPPLESSLSFSNGTFWNNYDVIRKES